MMFLPQVMAIDPSLTATGITCPDGTTLTVRSNLRGMARLADVRSVIVDLAGSAEIVAIEGYAYGSKFNRETLGELGGIIRLALWDASIPYVDIAPTQRAKYATGSGRSSKALCVAGIAARSGIVFGDDNQADAFTMWAMTLDAYGSPVVEMPAKHRAVLDAIEWPTIEKGTP